MSKYFFSRSRHFPTLLGLSLVLLLGSVDAAMAAQAETFGHVLCNAFQNAKPFGQVFQWVAYIAGVVFAIVSIYRFRLHSEDPRQFKLGVPLMFLFGSMCLLALPSVIGTIENSFFKPATGGLRTCMPGAVSVDSEGLDEMMIDFVGNIQGPLNLVTSLTAILVGLFFIVHGLMKAAKHGTDPRTYSAQSILVCLGFGAFLMMIGTNLDMMLVSLFGEGAKPDRYVNWSNIAALMGASAEGMKRFTDAVDAALLFVQLVGAIAFVRGWILLKQFSEGGGNTSLTQALTHMIGGVLAVNIGQFLKLMDKTFGVNLIQ